MSADEPPGPPNPLRREQDAFRVLMAVLLAALAVVGVAVALGSIPAAALGLALILLGLWRVIGWAREGLSSR